RHLLQWICCYTYLGLQINPSLFLLGSIFTVIKQSMQTMAFACLHVGLPMMTNWEWLTTKQLKPQEEKMQANGLLKKLSGEGMDWQRLTTVTSNRTSLMAGKPV